MAPSHHFDQDIDLYQQFCESLALQPDTSIDDMSAYSDREYLSTAEPDTRMTAALQVLFSLLMEAPNKTPQSFSKATIDCLLSEIDDVLSHQLDQILHEPQFQKLESLWRGVAFMLEEVDARENTYLSILNVSQAVMEEDLEDAADIELTGLYEHVYASEYDMPGGMPFAAIISDYQFSHHNRDITCLSRVAHIAALAHCPFIANVGAKFFAKASMDEVSKITDIDDYLSRAEYIKWHALRSNDNSRYLGLTMPEFLIRSPYNVHSRIRSFNYIENVRTSHDDYLWGQSSFAFGANLCRSFKQHGWAVDIRGPESGGRVENLELHYYDPVDDHPRIKMPTEILIPETRELELAEAGFIPLSYYKGRDYACFFSANSVHKALIFDAPEITANSRINARLPYVFLASRLGHYLKVIQREIIGSTINRAHLESALNDWINTLVTVMPNPGPDLIAGRPLRAARVRVTSRTDNPGYYDVELQAMPHFQVEGVDVRLSLKSQLTIDRLNHS